jgi:hypothetical protein
MAKPELEPGIYEYKRKLFIYKGDTSEKELTKHPYFNVKIQFPNGETKWTMEESSIISRARKLDSEEIEAKIVSLSSGRQTKRISQLVDWLKENSSS